MQFVPPKYIYVKTIDYDEIDIYEESKVNVNDIFKDDLLVLSDDDNDNNVCEM